MERRADCVVIGSGCAGTLLALWLARAGRAVWLVDRARHPRFALGESSTPLADALLHQLSVQYGTPELIPLTQYGAWKRHYPQLQCGIKRGFSYFRHESGQAFAADEQHSSELLVAASESDEVADTHWLRADVDQFLVERAIAAGVHYADSSVVRVDSRGPWRLSVRRVDDPKLDQSPVETIELTTDFIVDATGQGQWLADYLGLADRTADLTTRSWAYFAHVAGLRKWAEVLDQLGVDRREYPFDCDAAAVHHVLDEGWIWQLRFDHDVTSVGFVVCDGEVLSEFEKSLSMNPEGRRRGVWDQLAARYPSLGAQWSPQTKIVGPHSDWVGSGRLQRLWSPAAGPDWALLPNSAGFIDPLHSTGIAHSLTGVSRLLAILTQSRSPTERSAALARAGNLTIRELLLVDQLVSACHATRRSFPDFVLATLLYFVAVTRAEHADPDEQNPGRQSDQAGSFAVRGRDGSLRLPSFLQADDREFSEWLRDWAGRLRDPLRPRSHSVALRDQLRRESCRYTGLDLFDPQNRNLHFDTVAAKPLI